MSQRFENAYAPTYVMCMYLFVVIYMNLVHDSTWRRMQINDNILFVRIGTELGQLGVRNSQLLVVVCVNLNANGI